jgi:HEPN domain-containing protein
VAPRKIKTQDVDRDKASTFFERGSELLETAVDALEHERWSAVGVNSVHAAISLVDGLLVHRRGLRSTSPNHLDVIDLLSQELPDLPDLTSAQKHLRHILSEKNRVEYEARAYVKKDAESILRHVQRFSDWINRYK